MTRSSAAIFALAAIVGGAAWLVLTHGRAHEREARAPLQPIAAAIAPTLAATPTAATATTAVATSMTDDGEERLMVRLRQPGLDPETLLGLALEGNRAYPDSVLVEERGARAIDALVALDRIGEAHHEAQLFVQRYPAGPYTSHVSSLMGVHPRPTEWR